MNHTPRVAAIHDLSGLGRCSLTVALPVLSVMGCQCAPMPTAVLSSQTGGVTGYTFCDMTDQMAPIAAHWKAVDARFDAIYTGFLGSEAQLSLVERFFDDFADSNTLILVDPVMGDDGAAYDTYGPELIAGMAHLANRAHIITPNFTEAAFLLGLPGDSLKNGTVSPEEAVKKLSNTAVSVDGVLEQAKTKRYAYARLRRMVLWAYLGLTPGDCPDRPLYLRPLAANETGRALLGQMRKTAVVPVLTKPDISLADRTHI